MRTEHKEDMIQQYMVLRVCAIMWSLSRIYSLFHKTIILFEDILSERKSYFAIIAALDNRRHKRRMKSIHRQARSVELEEV